jgi:hypothetical protein
MPLLERWTPLREFDLMDRRVRRFRRSRHHERQRNRIDHALLRLHVTTQEMGPVFHGPL